MIAKVQKDRQASATDVDDTILGDDTNKQWALASCGIIDCRRLLA